MVECRFCKKDPCEDDCEELAMIFRDQQREKMLDIDISDMDQECMVCGCSIDRPYTLCHSCEL